jgi:PPOX class probable F420-dependent enzyme
MSAPLSAEARALLAGPNTAHLATVRRDGTPAVHPVWVGLDGDHVLVSTGRTTAKARNVAHQPAVAVSVLNQIDPYEELMLRGRVVDVRDDPDLADMHPISYVYTGKPFPFNSGRQVTLVIEPDWVLHHHLPFAHTPPADAE